MAPEPIFSLEIALDEFGAQVEAQLSELPGELRAQYGTELREHLRALVAARQSQGLDERAAWISAQTAFGEASEIGRELARQWKRAPRYETRGTSLSKREKGLKFARIMSLGAIYYLSVMATMTYLEKHGWETAFLPLLSIFAFGFGFWQWRRKGGIFTPATLFLQIAMAANLIWLNFHIIVTRAVLATPASRRNFDSGLIDRINIFWIPIFLVLLFVGMVWLKREEKMTKPWRQSARYAQNPVAAEEEYRLSAPLGLALGTTMSCIGSLWMGFQFFGWPIAFALCALQIGGALVAARFLR